MIVSLGAESPFSCRAGNAAQGGPEGVRRPPLPPPQTPKRRQPWGRWGPFLPAFPYHKMSSSTLLGSGGNDFAAGEGSHITLKTLGSKTVWKGMRPPALFSIGRVSSRVSRSNV